MSDAVECDTTARVPTGRKGRTERLTGTIIVNDAGLRFHYSSPDHSRTLLVSREQIAFVAGDEPSDGEATLRVTTKDGQTSEFALATANDVHAARDLLSGS